MKVKDAIKKLQELPEELQEKEFRVCLGHSPECDVEAFNEFYAQPEYRHVSYKGRPEYQPTGEISYITADGWS